MRLADGLSGDDTHSLANVHLVTAGKVPAVACAAHPVPRRAGDGGAHEDLVDPQYVQAFHPCLIEHGASGNDQGLCVHIENVLSHYPTEDPVAQGLDDVTTLDDGCGPQPFVGSAVDLGDDYVLSNVDQPAGVIP